MEFTVLANSSSSARLRLVYNSPPTRLQLPFDSLLARTANFTLASNCLLSARVAPYTIWHQVEIGAYIKVEQSGVQWHWSRHNYFKANEQTRSSKPSYRIILLEWSWEDANRWSFCTCNLKHVRSQSRTVIVQAG